MTDELAQEPSTRALHKVPMMPYNTLIDTETSYEIPNN
jgi:hypothetical protein